MRYIVLLWHAVWITRVILQAILLGFVVRRKVYLQFPWFLLYTIWSVGWGAFMIADSYRWFLTGPPYFEAYCVDILGVAILSFLILYELFAKILRDYPVLGKLGSSWYRITAMVLIALTLLLAWFAPTSAPNRLWGTFFVLQRSALLLQCGLLLFLLTFARSFGLPWKSRAFGIALGFGISAFISLTVAAVFGAIEPLSPNLMQESVRLIRQLGDLVSVVVWVRYLLAPEIKISQPPSFPENDLKSWNNELGGLTQ
jgi:hypothetical protein